MIRSRASDSSLRSSAAGQDAGGQGREPGARRKKLAGLLKSANELRQSYQQSYTSGWGSRDTRYEDVDDAPGAFPDAAVVRSGDEEMVIFPSYARKHIKRAPHAEPGTVQETPGDGRDVRDTTGTGDAEFWQQQWDNYEDDNAVVDVDVRGWIYSPHKGQMTRKHRLYVSIARQLVGIQAPPATKTSPSHSSSGSRSTSPHMSHRERVEARAARREEELASKEAESILKKGEEEEAIASKGGYSETPADEDPDNISPYNSQSRRDSPIRDSRRGSHNSHLTHVISNNSLKSDDGISPVQKRASWNQPANMSPAELSEANSRLMTRLMPFMANPLGNTPISVFFYNDKISKLRTVYTNPTGHFNVRAALDFIPTQVRIMVSENLSATEDVIISEPSGVSLISDIDDTIKHSAIGSGAREIFRNAFIRELGDLTIEGVREWYTRLSDIGVKFHYVSNSPWQLYPVLTKFFAMAGLPPGSFHLKEYSGMLQGIFEPVAERKKSTLDKIARDFPERSFILVGDSGEADLEVYTDFVLENPGRVLGVFIRDVTTQVPKGFFDSSMGPLAGERSSNSSSRNSGNSGTSRAARSQIPSEEDEDPDLKTAIAASLRDMEQENRVSVKSWPPVHSDDAREKRPQLPPRKTTQPRAPEPHENLIDFSDEETKLPSQRPSHFPRSHTDTETEATGKRGSVTSTTSTKSMPPLPPRKPAALRSSSGEQESPSPSSSKAPPLPKPRRPSTTVHNSSPLTHQVQTQSTPYKQNPQAQQSYASTARQKISSAYNSLPSASSYLYGTPPTGPSSNDPAPSDNAAKRAAPPPPPPPRRGISSYPTAAASYATTKVSGAWNGSSAAPGPSPAQANPYGTTSAAQHPVQSTGSSLGPNGNGGGNGGGGAGNGNGNGQVLNKKEQLWRQRWAHAAHTLEQKGVVLRSWRVGFDVLDEAMRLVEEAKRREERARKDGGSGRRGDEVKRRG